MTLCIIAPLIDTITSPTSFCEEIISFCSICYLCSVCFKDNEREGVLEHLKESKDSIHAKNSKILIMKARL